MGRNPNRGAVEWTNASVCPCRNKALVETLELMHFNFSITVVHVVVDVRISKGKGYTSSEDILF